MLTNRSVPRRSAEKLSPESTGSGLIFFIRDSPSRQVSCNVGGETFLASMAKLFMFNPMTPKILFCNCTYAQVIPNEVKTAVLEKLCASGVAFEAVSDLCEMSARRDSSLPRLAEGGHVKIAACYPRAVKWLFAAAHAPLDLNSTEVLNMRVQTAEEVISGLFNSTISPNLPRGKETVHVVQDSETPETTA